MLGLQYDGGKGIEFGTHYVLIKNISHFSMALIDSKHTNVSMVYLYICSNTEPLKVSGTKEEMQKVYVRLKEIVNQ